MTCLVRLGGAVAATVLLALPAQAQSLKPWRQAMILPKADAGFFLMTAKRGFAEREGLKVEVLDVKDDPIGMKALLSGEVDSYVGVYGAIAASARGADVKLLGCNWHAAPYVMLARPGVDRIEDLRGKSIAASSPGTPPDMVARAALVRAKVPPAEVKIAAVGSSTPPAIEPRRQHPDKGVAGARRINRLDHRRRYHARRGVGVDRRQGNHRHSWRAA